jgi:hypothetical protein
MRGSKVTDLKDLAARAGHKGPYRRVELSLNQVDVVI